MAQIKDGVLRVQHEALKSAYFKEPNSSFTMHPLHFLHELPQGCDWGTSKTALSAGLGSLFLSNNKV